MNPSTTTSAESHSRLQLTRLIKAPLRRVYAAWTTPAEVGHWLGTENWQTEAAEIDLRVGGEYRFTMFDAARRKIEMSGVYREIEPPTRLVFTWNQQGLPAMGLGETLVTVDLADVNGATEVRLTHEGFTSEERRQGHLEGWEECLDKMESLLLDPVAAASP